MSILEVRKKKNQNISCISENAEVDYTIHVYSKNWNLHAISLE